MREASLILLAMLVDPVLQKMASDGANLDGVSSGGRVVVAMSGGVDSSVCAALCQRAGYEVVGITLQLYNQGEATRRSGACCAGADIYDAKMVASVLGIAHYVLDYEDRFRSAVIDEFVDEYLAGSTPIPCIRCNQTVKFEDLLETARDLDAEALVTGHYVQRVSGLKSAELHRAVDLERDQSYFLFMTTLRQLDYLRFPLGHLADKSVTRILAKLFDLPVAAKPDSQDICFVPDGNYGALIDRLRPGAAEPGDIVDQNGQVLGRHRGVIHFTVGQRRGLGLSAKEPLYVLKLDAAQRQVLVGPRSALGQSYISIRDVNWLDQLPPTGGREVQVKIRSSHSPVPGLLVMREGSISAIELISGNEAVAPGQACVFYDCEKVLGGGWIDLKPLA